VAEATVYCVLLRRSGGVSRTQFLRRWLDEHRKLAEQLPGLDGVRLLPVEEPADGFDGVGLLFFASRKAMESALASPAAARLRSHTATFADSDASIRMLLSDPAAGRGR
jgi:uncharacterized protein (TIGR02118 family)